jgi:hypothetical protein
VAVLYQGDPTDVNGRLSAGTLTDDDLVAGDIDALLEVLQGGFGYINVHTTANPGGELRGQVAPIPAKAGSIDSAIGAEQAGFLARAFV